MTVMSAPAHSGADFYMDFQQKYVIILEKGGVSVAETVDWQKLDRK